MKHPIRIHLLAISLLVSILSPTVFATNTTFKIATAYPKGNANYNIVVKASPGLRLALYINDAVSYKATVNKQHWATFHKVKLTDTAKLSFTRIITSGHSTYQKPIHYVQYASLTADKVSFISSISKVQPTVATSSVPTPAPVPTATVSTPQDSAATATTNTGVNDTNLSNTTTYTNSSGTTVHSPADSTDGQVPDGATALCNDGTYSFSQSHSGTCSHHGGVSAWL